MKYFYLVVVMVVVMNPRAAVAQSVDEEATISFENGTTLFGEARYEEAATAFREAYKLKASWKLLYNIGQAEAAAKRYGLALEAFGKYVAQGGDEINEERSSEVISEMKRLRELVGVLEVEGAPKGADVFVDDIFRASLPLVTELRIAAGIDHTVSIRVNDKEIHSQTIMVGSAGTATVRVEPDDASAPATIKKMDTGNTAKAEPDTGNTATVTPSSQENPPPSSNHRALKAVLFTSAGLAVATGGAALGFWLAAGSQNDELEKQNDLLPSTDPKLSDLKTKVETYDAVTTAMLISAGVFSAVAVVTAIVLVKKNKTNKKAVTLGPNSISVRF